MTELIYHVAVTADNFIAGPNGEADDSIFLHDGDLVDDFLGGVSRYDAVLMVIKKSGFAAAGNWPVLFSKRS